MLRQASQNGASDAPDAFAAASLAALTTPPEVCLETMVFNVRRTLLTKIITESVPGKVQICMLSVIKSNSSEAQICICKQK